MEANFIVYEYVWYFLYFIDYLGGLMIGHLDSDQVALGSTPSHVTIIIMWSLHRWVTSTHSPILLG